MADDAVALAVLAFKAYYCDWDAEWGKIDFDNLPIICAKLTSRALVVVAKSFDGYYSNYLVVPDPFLVWEFPLGERGIFESPGVLGGRASISVVRDGRQSHVTLHEGGGKAWVTKLRLRLG